MKRSNLQIFNQLVLSGVANCPAPLNKNSILQWSNNGQINQNVIVHLNSYLVNPNFILQDQIGPYEIHPYLNREKGYFDLNRSYLLLGTFPPNSYIRNVPGINAPVVNPNVRPIPNVDFFYGNEGNLWNILGIGNNPTLAAVTNFLDINSIAVSDVVLGAQRKKYKSPNDSDLYNIVLNDQLISILNKGSKIESVLLTSGSLNSLRVQLNGNLDINTGITTLKGFLQILIDNNLDFEISGDPNGNGPYHPFTNIGIQAAIAQQNGHIIWWIKTGNKKIRIINLPSPSPNGNLRIPGSPFFRRWVIWKALQNRIAPPAIGINLMQNYLPLHNIFIQRYTSQYKQEIYQLALNDITTLQTI